MDTLDTAMARRNGHTTGFDYLRLALAVLVLFGHSFLVTGTMAAPDDPWRLFAWRLRGHLVLPMFFALSGFLVAGSLVRVRRLPAFLGLRVLRILPALAVEVVLSALLLGPLVTTLPWDEYVSSPELPSYFLNLLGWPQYRLPGVFADNAHPFTVNGSLWTVPYEAECYLLLAVLAVVGLAWRPRALSLAVAALVGALVVYQGLVVPAEADPRGTVTGRQLVVFFLAGCSLSLGRERVPHTPWLAGLALVVTALTVTSHQWIYLSVFPVAYITAYLGLLSPKRLPVILNGDYSYGIYLYAFPVQQTVQHLLGLKSPFLNFGLSLPVTACFAALSWHVVEEPLQRLRRRERQAPASQQAPVPGARLAAEGTPRAL